MYIIKNAIRCIGRAKGRNILIGIIVLVIATSACVGLSIRQAAESAKEDTLDSLSVTAAISFDRQSMMSEMGGRGEMGGSDGENGGEPPQFDREQFSQMMGAASGLTLDEYLTYAEADSVKDFYYSLTSSVNGSDSFEPVSTDTSSDDEASTETESVSQNGMPGGNMGGSPDNMGGGRGGMMGNMMEMSQTDFSIVGYSHDDAMTSFMEGTASITEGAVFDEGTESYDCIISEELATFNDLSVGDTVVITNPNNEEETYELTVVGFYTDSSANENSFSMMSFSNSDPANKIYMSYTALKSIVDASAEVSSTVTDEDTGMEFETALSSSLSGTYTFADTDAYYQFEEDVREMGLDDTYTVSSTDITAFENSLLPLQNLSTMAGWFLLVILIIGAIILVVLNIFNVRERKYEIGVLTAMGMKKGKVAMQFLTEIFMVTIVSVIIGIVIGAVSAVPVTNALLENQIASQQTQADRREESFGRPGNMGGQADMGISDGMGGNMQEPPQGGGFMDMFGGGQVAEYVTEINSAMNFTVVLQMFAIAILLTLIAGAASMLFIMRYEPLKILANRD